MILKRLVTTDGEVHFTDGQWELANMHQSTEDCATYGCVVHNPTPGPLSNAPYNWRTDRGIMERICKHGVGHPDHDSVNYFTRTGQKWQATHGCCGCCALKNEINPPKHRKEDASEEVPDWNSDVWHLDA